MMVPVKDNLNSLEKRGILHKHVYKYHNFNKVDQLAIPSDHLSRKVHGSAGEHNKFFGVNYLAEVGYMNTVTFLDWECL